MSVFNIAAKGTLSEDTVRWFLKQAGYLMYTLHWFFIAFCVETNAI